MKRLFFLCVLPFLIFSCNKYPADIREALTLAGKNKPELQKVLDHYSQKPEDSLKYKAACFLISNLRWHYGKQVKPSEKFWDEFLVEDSLSRTKIANPSDTTYQSFFYKFKQNEKKKKFYSSLEDTGINDSLFTDANCLTSEFLIHTIEGAFKVRNLPWNKHLTFDDFCEYILPYRFHEEPVYDIRERLYNQFIHLASKDSISNNPLKAGSAINQYINFFNWDWDNNDVKLPDLGFYNIFFWNNSNLTCAHHLAIEGQILRSAGIPVIEIFTPKWRTNNLSHSWCGMLTDKAIVPFSPVYQEPGSIKKEHQFDKATKFYMKTFAVNKNTPFFLKNEEEMIPGEFSSPCINDVTNLLVNTHDITLEISEIPRNTNLCYFSLFIYRKWEPIGWGIINPDVKTVTFKNIPDGIVGIPCIYEDNELRPCGKLVQTNTNGLCIPIAPSKEKCNVHLIRKYPPKAGLQAFNDEVLGTSIVASNRADFNPSVQLSTLKDTLMPYFQDHTFPNNNYYRYYRLTAPLYSLHFAELEFLTDKNRTGLPKASYLPVFENADTIQPHYNKLQGKLMGTRKDSLAFDGKPLTFTFQKELTIDFGKAEKINRIRILPRNADNGIVPGNSYELFYWKDGWISLGEKVAKYNFLSFEGVPEGTLYWLKNNTTGHEEQAFFYRDGKQVFMNN